jgi:photosystem II stability/assembly factor-like uncharacterized protein
MKSKTLLLLAVIFFIPQFAHLQWVKMVSFPDRYVTDIMITGNAMYVCTLSGGVAKTTDAGATWNFYSGGINFYPANRITQIIEYQGKLLISTGDGVYQSTNGGVDWVKKSTGLIVGGGATSVFSESIFDSGNGLITGCHTGIYRSTDGAESWSLVYSSGTHVYAKNLTFHSGKLFAARETNNTPNGFVSNDSGRTWSNLTQLSFPTITFYSEPGMLWAGTIHGAWLSTNDGANWVSRSNGLSPDPYNSSFIRVNNVLISSLEAGGSGMYKTTDNGLNWMPFEEGLPFLTAINELLLLGNDLLAATSEGIYKRPVSNLTSSQNTAVSSANDFSLNQNFPNPFNPETVIQFSILKSNFTSLTVYDAKGREVQSLLNQRLEAGNHEIKFSSLGLASGIYFYRLVSGEFISTKSMIVLK